MDAELKLLGIKALVHTLGEVQAERFGSMMLAGTIGLYKMATGFVA